MPQLPIADKATLDAVNAKAGTTADEAGTTTIFARLAQIAAYVDQLEGFTDTLEINVGSNADAASSAGSAHAKLKELRALVDTLEGSLGQTGDAASATGSANAKLAYLVSKNSYFPQPAINITSRPNPSSSWTTFASLTGKGIIRDIYITFKALADEPGGTGYIELRITLDGIQHTYVGTIVSMSSGIGSASVNYGYMDINYNYTCDIPLLFNSSILIEYRSITTGTLIFDVTNADSRISYRFSW